ncbi:MAG: tRNA uridine-5-carboxymethylaminomethyl(34) synthesis GTPase MnmE [Alphaproteobacteria bacterium]|nr:tRNA uridine-5-carboxymethylaminomethyl(34) synthesis GTPase MnmE [Alphaproteobacteria bacterium]
MQDDTIFAISSGAGPAAIAVLRVSGARAKQVLESLADRPVVAPREAMRVWLRDAKGEPLDDGLALWFPGPASYSGEDIVELHLHGGRAVIAGVVDVVAAMEGLRPAEPGEFTRRAFENGKLDLTAAEGVGDLIAAETEAQRRQALRQMDGALARLYDGWREQLIRALAHLEAAIDFADEDLPEQIARDSAATLEQVETEIAAHLDDDHRGERLRDGLYVAILGAPNVGKSTLLNRLARREAAIVSAQAGTTRDVIEVHLNLAGYPVILADTAGLRDAADEIEEEGVRRARERAAAADLKIAVFDAKSLPELDQTTAALVDEDCVPVLNKADLLEDKGSGLPGVDGRALMPLSARTGEGVEEVLTVVSGEVAQRWPTSAAPALTRVRHRRALEECVSALARARGASLPELVAEDARLAVRALGRITGRVDVEDLLDVIFRDFCIGK